jgi:hypothetical protein
MSCGDDKTVKFWSETLALIKIIVNYKLSSSKHLPRSELECLTIINDDLFIAGDE